MKKHVSSICSLVLAALLLSSCAEVAVDTLPSPAETAAVASTPVLQYVNCGHSSGL